MKQVFCDRKKKVFVKVCATSAQADREIVGAGALRVVARVPEIEKLDNQTLAVTKVPGRSAAQVSPARLNKLVKDYLVKLKKAGELQSSLDFSVTAEIGVMIAELRENKGLVKELKRLQRILGKLERFPVHGDLQKQNMFLDGKELSLIDFEHFLLAPRELELVNSLYYSDENCLDLKGILPDLVRTGELRVDLVEILLEFYALKQLVAGRKKLREVLGGELLNPGAK